MMREVAQVIQERVRLNAHLVVFYVLPGLKVESP